MLRLGRTFFFFQAEDGIRCHCVTGVQTCALPISEGLGPPTSGAGERVYRTPHVPRPAAGRGFGAGLFPVHSPLQRESWLVSSPPLTNMLKFSGSRRLRSEERRVRTECRSRWWSDHEKKKDEDTL